jgi:putative copper export protein/methionine-rich copper-binding protein CopC
MRRAFLFVLLTSIAVVSFADRADAHAKLLASEPAAGADVRTLDRVVLRFEEPIETNGVHIWLEDADGLYPLGPATHPEGDSRAISVPVPAIASNRYTVGYHIVSQDGDIVTGSVPFTFNRAPVGGGEPEPLPAPVAGVDDLPVALEHSGHSGDLPAGAAKMLLDASLASLIGGIAFVVTVWPQGAGFRSTRRLLWIAAFAAAVASFSLAVIQHAAAADLGVFAALSPRHLWQSMHYRFGRVAAARVALIGIAAFLTTRLGKGGATTARSARWCAAAAAVAVGLFETVVLLGHNGRGGAVTEAARFIHTIGVSVWLGGLLMLLLVVLPRRGGEELAALLPRFSMLATVAVGSLVVAGTMLAVDLVGAANALPSTTYGRVLLLKLVVVAALLVVARRTRDHVRHRLAKATTKTRRLALVGPVTTLVGVEIGLITVVLVLTALLVSQAPPG